MADGKRGRRKGGRNETTIELERWFNEALNKVDSGWDHPMFILLKIANNKVEGEEVPVRVRASAANQLMPYLAPKMPERVELTGQEGGPLEYSAVREKIENLLNDK